MKSNYRHLKDEEDYILNRRAQEEKALNRIKHAHIKNHKVAPQPQIV